jgi:predicted transcriptional regulator
MPAANVMSVKIDPAMALRIERLAKTQRRTRHWVMREAIEQYVEREEKREAFRRDTLEAWKEYQTTGLHLSADEPEAWLDVWGNERELPTPICHM